MFDRGTNMDPEMSSKKDILFRVHGQDLQRTKG